MERLKHENWIWLSKKRYPEYQNTYLSEFSENKQFNYCVAEFARTYKTEKKIEKLVIRVSGDTNFRLWLNGEYIGEGPVNESRDFFALCPYMNRYSNLYTVFPDTNELNFYADVQLSPIRMNDFSRGHGGFMLSALAFCEDGTSIHFETDETWHSRINRKHPRAFFYNASNSEDEWGESDVAENIWNTIDAPIPMLSMEKVKPVSDDDVIEVLPGTESVVNVFFDKIYAAHVAFDIECDGICSVEVKCYEKSICRYSSERVTANKTMSFRSIQLHSIGAYELTVINNSDKVAQIKPYAVATCYPVEEEGYFKCSDSAMNKVFEVCKWTTRICRQTMHLDSPLHQEPLACTGDYYIESLISAFCFGDMRLAEFDVVRTAELLRNNNGKMFHTTYSLIWVQMLYDVYSFTGNKKLLDTCVDALHILLNRFNGYIGETGLIENPPDYMFVDWIVADGYSLHHPPKALGQTCLNAFYYGALKTASKICSLTGDTENSEKYSLRADKLKTAFNDNLYDAKEGIYFDGLNTPSQTNEWLPKNSTKRYYSKHSNTLAVLYGLCDEKESARIMERVVTDKELIDVQPYFMHFVLSALRKAGIFEKYGFKELDKWKPSIEEFGKGLQEGWLAPEDGYPFDYSHAWGGTPAYQLPKQLLGLEMVEAGYKKIVLKPRLYDYEYAYISVPTPFGYITCSMKKGRKTQVCVPEEIECEIL